MSPRPVLAPMLVLAVVLASCSATSSDPQPSRDAPSEAEVAEVLERLADEVIVPGYAAFAESMEDFAAATGALCDEPDDANLEGAQEAWRSAVLAYEPTRAVAVGPAMDRRLMSAVAFEARSMLIDDLLAGDEPIDAEGLRQQGSAVRGLYAAEHALFGEGSQVLASSDGARRCGYVDAIAEVSGAAAAEVADDWVDGDAREAFLVGDGEGPQASVAAITNEVSQRLDGIDTGGLRDMSGAASADDLAEDRADGPAGYALAGRKALAEGLVAVVGDKGSGIGALVASRDPELAERLVSAAAAAEAAMAALPDSVAEAFADPDAIDAAAEAIAELEVLISTEVASKLGVTITFGDSDGDG